MAIAVASLALVATGMVFAGSDGTAGLEAGDEAYFCQCGEKCPCDTISSNPGKCTCGVDLVKGKVTQAGSEEITADVDGRPLGFKTTGEYACACGPECDCNTISQNPGNCTCGVEMKKVQ